MIQNPLTISPDYHKDVYGLQKSLSSLPTLAQLCGIRDEKIDPDRLVNRTFARIKNEIKPGGEWEWVMAIKDPFQAMSALLIEGYGDLIARTYRNPELKRIFVKAFEEVLWTGGQNSLLLNDVVNWMVEERNDFPEKIKHEVGGVSRYGRDYADATFLGNDPSILDESWEALLYIEAWSQGCPNPDKVAEKFGLDWTLRRYAETNFWTGWLVDKMNSLNKNLHDDFVRVLDRNTEEPVGSFDPLRVPDSYKTRLGLMSTPWGYAASRVLIEQFGRGTRKSPRTLDKVIKGMALAEKSMIEAKSPTEFVVKLANKVTRANAEVKAVLGHIFAAELAEEGKMYLMNEVVKEMRVHAPHLWQEYVKIGHNNYTNHKYHKYTNYKEGINPDEKYLRLGMIPPHRLFGVIMDGLPVNH